MLYRIFTENTPEYKATAIKATAEYFDGFSVFEGTGYWEGTGEHCLCIEISRDDDVSERVRELAAVIKLLNRQQAVLIQQVPCTNTFI